MSNNKTNSTSFIKLKNILALILLPIITYYYLLLTNNSIPYAHNLILGFHSERMINLK